MWENRDPGLQNACRSSGAVAGDHKGDLWSKEDILWAAEQFAEIAVTDHLASLPAPEVMLDIRVDQRQVGSALWKAVTVAVSQHLSVAGKATRRHGLGS